LKNIYYILFISITTLCAQAQERWSVAFRPQLNFPTSSFMDTSIRVGNGLELEATYDVLPHLTFYTGVHWSQFDTNEQFDEDHINFNQSGYILGGRLRLPFNKSKIGYYLSAGTIYSRIRITSDNVAHDQKTTFKVNWQFGAGVQIPVFEHWVFAPEIRYRPASNAKVIINTIEEALAIDFITISAGIVYTF